MRGLSYLAFAAGYRRVSFVFIEDGQLATWHTSCVAAQSAEQAGKFASELIELLMPDVIVFEDVAAGTRKGETAQALLCAIREKAEQSNARILPLEREKLFRTRYDEVIYLVREYEELADKVPSRKFTEREPHHMVLFEALALGHQAVVGGTLLLASKM